jgi:hypothetical protein
LLALEVHWRSGLVLGPDIHGVSVTQSPSLPPWRLERFAECPG